MKASHWPISILSSVSSLIQMAMPLVLVRILAPEDVGRFKIFFLYAMIFPAFSLTSGLINGLSYWAGREGARTRAFRASSAWLALLGGTFAILVYVLRGSLPAISEFDSGTAGAFSIAVLCAIAAHYFDEASIAQGQVWRGALFGASFEVTRTAAILAAALATRDVSVIFFTHAGVSLLKMTVGFVWASVLGFGWTGGGALDRDTARSVLRYSIPVSLAWMFGVFTNYADQVILAAHLDAAAFALYSIGCLAIPPLMLLEHSVARVLIPELSRAFDRGDSPAASRLYRQAIDELGWILIPAVAGLVVFADPIIQLLFTDAYADSARYLSWFALSYLALMIPYDSVARARGDAKWILGFFTAFSVLSLVLCYGLSRMYGTMGALAGLLISKAAMRGYALLSIRSLLRDFVPIRSLVSYGVIAAVLGLGAAASRELFASPLSWLLTAGGIFTCAYFMATLFLTRARLKERRTGQPRVLMLTQYLGIGGLERMILNLSLTLRERARVEPRVFVFDHDRTLKPDSHMVEVFRAQGIEVETFSKPRGFSLRAVWAIRSAILRDGVDVIHSHDLGALIYAACVKISVRATRPVRLVHTQHSFVHLARRRRYAYYERFFARFADELCVVSDDTRKGYLEVGVNPDRIHSIPNGVSFLSAAEASSRVQHPATSDVTILYMARVHGRKGQEHAIALWRELSHETRIRCKLVFVGPETEAGQATRLMSLIVKAPDRDHIVYHGPTHAPKEWLATADLFLSCSEFEGMPLGPLEAGGSGLPLLLSRIEGHLLLGEHYPLYDLKDPKEGARHLESIVSGILASRAEGKEAARLSALWTASTWIRERYSMAAMTASYEDLYSPQGRR